jgi:hypothetical protein
VLLVDDSAYMRNIVRSLLNNIGVKRVSEAGDGFAKLGFRARVEEPQFARVVARHRIIQQPRQSVRSIH